MPTTTETPPAEKRRPPDPIPGYKLLERIGAGGYGEVWRANVPGDLTKAVKLVYGHLDQRRAASELKSLNRIKEVRHPFLLSLERIEIVDGRLVIVSELAESSLRELLQECQRAGMPGIPRERLIAFLKDAADALDYLCQQHGLQHLDVKPENMLLVGGRVKVADFGLVRELFDATASLLGGLTPVYAPPEVFDGAPGRYSDQYSLAIVFQELLTGTLPFAGRTAAQLAAQHLHSRPRLDALPPADRPAITKALSKDPAKRFPNCRALIDSLIDGVTVPAPRSGLGGRIRPRDSRPSASPQVAKTEPINARKMAAQASRLDEHAGAELVQLAPVELANTEFRCRPTLVVGVGGTGCAVLQGLKARLRDRFENFDQIPAFQMLLLDTDRETLVRASDRTNRGALDVMETLAIPLRPAQEYRRTAHQFLAWMSRRWIYNVPRSLTTEGLRPIGRLALADHAEAVKRRLQSAVAAACAPDGVTKSSERTGLKFDGGCPQVFLVGSISGGSGSGMLLDLAYLLRQILGQRGLHDESIFGILSHATDRHSNRRDLAVANALAFLVELNHYSQPAGHYPGEASSGVASHNGPTFSHTYLVHLGDDLTRDTWEEATQQLAEYTYRNIATTAARFFQRCRAAGPADAEASREVALRSFGVCQVGCAVSDMSVAAAVTLCRRLVDEWRGELKDPQAKPTKFYQQRSLLESGSPHETSLEASTDQLAAAQAAALELNAAKLTELATAAATSELGRSPEEFFERLVVQFHAKRGDRDRDHPETAHAELLNIVDTLLGTGSETSGGFVPLQESVSSHIDDFVNQRVGILRDWVHRLADTSRARLKGAARAAQWFIHHLESVATELNNRLDELSVQCDALRQALITSTAPAENEKSRTVDPDQTAVLRAEYFYARFAQVSVRTAYRIARQLAQVKLSMLSDQIRDLARALGNIAQQFDPPAAPQTPGNLHDDHGVLDDIHLTAKESLDRQLPELAAELESLLFHDQTALSRLLARPAEVNADFVERIRTAARSLIHRALKRDNVVNVVLPSIQGGGAQQFMEAAEPSWSACGGGKRLLVVAPPEGELAAFESQLAQSVGQPLNLLFDADNDLLFCYETEATPLVAVAHEIMQSRHDLAEVADRLHTRIDVDWTSL